MSRRVYVRGSRDLARLRPRSQEAFFNAAEAISEARRRGTTIAAEVERLQQNGIRVSRYGVRRYFGDDLERGPGGWLVPKRSDRSYHGRMLVTSTKGVLARPVHGSRARSLVAEHANAVKRYLNTGETNQLERFRGKHVAGLVLETDPDALDDLQRAGELDFLDLYEGRA
jgi:hypothetical protein